jgi:hypothetical protein
MSNKVIATRTYFANKNQLKAIIVNKYIRINSKMLYVAGMKTESKFANVYVDFTRKKVFHFQFKDILPHLK